MLRAGRRSRAAKPAVWGTALAAGAALVISAPQAFANTDTVTRYVYDNGNTNNYIDALQLFYNSDTGGATAMFTGDVNDYAGYDDHCDDNTVCEHIYVFSSSGSGAGQRVKNNAASAYNNSIYHDFTVYYYSGWTGPSQTIPGPYHVGNPLNFNSTLKNENASQKAF